MTTKFEVEKIIDTYRKMLKEVKEDITFTYGIIDGLKMKESHIRDGYRKTLTKYDDMLERSKMIDQHDLLGALVIKVDRIGDDAWKITFRMKGGNVVEMYGDDEDHFIVCEA